MGVKDRGISSESSNRHSDNSLENEEPKLRGLLQDSQDNSKF